VSAPAVQRTTAPPRVLTVRRPLGHPPASARPRLLGTMRGLFVRRVLVLVAVLVLLCLARVWLGNQIVRIGYDLSDARQMRARLEQDKQALEVELTMLKDRGTLEERARRRLGMTEPRKGQVVDLR